MEVIGATASVTGVIGFVGQIAGGCKTVKEIFGDVKDASQHVLQLRKEISFIEETSRKTLQLHKDLKPFLGPDEVPANAVCYLEEIKAVEDKIRSSAAMFEAKTTGAKDSLKRTWHRLKYAGNKEEIEEILRWVERTKSQILLVQQNLTLALQINQGTSMKEANTSLHTLRRSVEKGTATQAMLESTVRHQIASFGTLSNTSTIASATSTQVCGDLVPTMQDLRVASVEAMQSLREELPFIVQAAVAQVLERGASAHSENLSSNQEVNLASSERSFMRTDNKSSEETDFSTAGRQPPSSYKDPSYPKKKLRVSKTERLYRLLGIRVFIEYYTQAYEVISYSGDSEALSSKYRTTVSIQMNVPWLKGGIRIRQQPPTSNFVRGSSINLRPYVIHRPESPFAVAARDFNIQSMRKLFSLRQASLLDLWIQDEEFSYSEGNLMKQFPWIESPRIGCKEMLTWIQFLIQCSQEAGQLISDSTLYSIIRKHQKEDDFEELLNLLLSHSIKDPTESINLLLLVEETSEDSPLIRFFLNQDCWHIDLNLHEISAFPGVFFENEKHVLQDPVGSALQSALEKAYTYGFLSKRFAYRFDRLYESQILLNPPAFELLDFVRTYTGKHTKEFVKKCFSSRLLILMGAGMDPNEPLVWSQSFWHPGRYESLMQYSVRTNMDTFLETVLLESSMSEKEVHALFEKNMYCGVSELMSGELQYSTIEEFRIEFLDSLCTGSYSSLPDQNPDYLQMGRVLSGYLDELPTHVYQAIKEAHKAYSIRTCVPGSWPDELAPIVAGKDFKIPWCPDSCQKSEKYHEKCRRYKRILCLGLS